MKRTPEQVLERMGFPAAIDTPYVREIRDHVTKQMEDGLIDHSGGTWAGSIADYSPETRAKAILAMNWAFERGWAYEQKALDGLRWWSKNRNGTWSHPNLIEWLGDLWRETGMKFRVFRDRYILRLKNPYE